MMPELRWCDESHIDVEDMSVFVTVDPLTLLIWPDLGARSTGRRANWRGVSASSEADIRACFTRCAGLSKLP